MVCLIEANVPCFGRDGVLQAEDGRVLRLAAAAKVVGTADDRCDRTCYANRKYSKPILLRAGTGLVLVCPPFQQPSASPSASFGWLRSSPGPFCSGYASTTAGER